MRGTKAKKLRKEVFGGGFSCLQGRKYAEQKAVVRGALVSTGAIVAMGLRAEYQALKKG